MDTCSFSLMKLFKCFSCLPQVSNTNVSTAPSNPPTPMPSTNVIASDGKQRYLRTERIVQLVRHAREVKVLAIQCSHIPERARFFLGFPGSVLVTATCSWRWCWKPWVTLSTTSLTWTDLEPSLGLRGEWPATNILSRGKIKCVRMYLKCSSHLLVNTVSLYYKSKTVDAGMQKSGATR